MTTLVDVLCWRLGSSVDSCIENSASMMCFFFFGGSAGPFIFDTVALCALPYGFTMAMRKTSARQAFLRSLIAASAAQIGQSSFLSCIIIAGPLHPTSSSEALRTEISNRWIPSVDRASTVPWTFHLWHVCETRSEQTRYQLVCAKHQRVVLHS